MDDGPPEMALVMPFVVCATNGGPYDDASFVAGCYFAQAQARLDDEGRYEQFVPPALVPQLDLLAMERGLAITSEPWDEHPDEWTRVAIGRAT